MILLRELSQPLHISRNICNHTGNEGKSDELLEINFSRVAQSSLLLFPDQFCMISAWKGSNINFVCVCNDIKIGDGIPEDAEAGGIACYSERSAIALLRQLARLQ